MNHMSRKKRRSYRVDWVAVFWSLVGLAAILVLCAAILFELIRPGM